MRRFLYHGSKFDNKGEPLVPGIVHSQKEVFWDGKFESNRFLYACAGAENAILLGIGSMAEKEVGTIGFLYSYEDREAQFLFKEDELITVEKLEKLLEGKGTYLYTIQVAPEHGWVQNKNLYNNIDDEYKTMGEIPAKDYALSDIKVIQWLKKNNWKLVTRLRDE